MGMGKKTFGMGIALCITACSSTRLPMGRDAAVTVSPPADATIVLPDAAGPQSDTGLIRADPDTAPSVPDTATVVPDTAMVRADTAPSVPDAATVVSDTATAPVDTARPFADGPTIAPNPYANRTFRIGPETPAPTPDATCTQYGPSDYFQLTFGADTTTVTVLVVSGSSAKAYHAAVGPEANKLTYHFTDFPTGGIITFEQDQGVEVAQVILYGSGRPVVQCLRGALTPQP